MAFFDFKDKSVPEPCDIWKKYDYHELGIENEPYLDTDFSKTFYRFIYICYIYSREQI